MNKLVYHLGQMLRLRSGPQNLPSSWAITLIVLAIYTGQSVIASQQLAEQQPTRMNPGASTLMAITIQLLAVYLILRTQGRAARLPQTILALAGTAIPVGLAMFGVLLLATPDENQLGLFLVLMALIVWSVAVEAHIYRNAFDVPLSIGVLISVLIFAVHYLASYFLL